MFPNGKGETITVDDSGGEDYEKIQDAVDAASDRDTVFVFNGTYYEHIAIDVSINLTGESQKNTTVSDDYPVGFDIKEKANYVNLSNFTIISEDYGVKIRFGHNRIFNLTMKEGNGVNIFKDYNILYNLNITAKTHLSAIELWDANKNKMFNNTISNKGVEIDGDNNHFYNNIFSDMKEGSKLMRLRGIKNNIENNTFHGGEYGIHILNNLNYIKNNSFSNCSEAGIFLEGPNNKNRIEHCLFRNCNEGMHIHYSDKNKIKYCDFRNNTKGIRISNDNWGDSNLNKVNHCNFTNNTNFGIKKEDSPDDLNATDNWWGSSSGPYHSSDRPNAEGDRISNNIKCNPWRKYHSGSLGAYLESIYPLKELNKKPIRFRGHGTTNGTIVKYVWRSDKDGEFYNGTEPECKYSELSNGTHTIYFKVKENSGRWSNEVSGSVTINGRPVSYIDSISPSPAITGEVISFSGHGTDDGFISNYSWRSYIDGEIYNGSESSFDISTLSHGNHHIYLSVQDNNGSWSYENHTRLYINKVPTANINYLNPDPVLLGESVYFEGWGEDDHHVKRYVWYSDIDGEFYNDTEPSCHYSGLSIGIHQISYKVRDDENVWSPEVNTTLNVTRRPEVSIKSINPNPAIDNENIHYTANATDDGEIVRYVWSSDRDGELYNNTDSEFSTSPLSKGEHIITVKVKDDFGYWSEENSTNLIVHSRPTCEIVSIEPEFAVDTDTVHFAGVGDDDDEIVRYVWTSSINGEFYNDTEEEFDYHGLSFGEHTIGFSVMDENGAWSLEDTAYLTINRTAPVTHYVGGTGEGNYTTINEALDETKNGDTVFVHKGTYHEHVLVNNIINLTGENRESTIINGSGTGSVLTINSDSMNLTGFTVTQGNAHKVNNGILVRSDKVSISEVNVTQCHQGIIYYESDNGLIENCNIGSSNEFGIMVYNSDNTAISGNHFLDRNSGLYITYSKNCRMRDNIFSGTGLYLTGDHLEEYTTHDIDISNLVNGNPLYYLSGVNSETVPLNAGQVILANCRNVTASQLPITNTSTGVILAYSQNCSVSDSIFRNNSAGIILRNSSGNNLMGNTIEKSSVNGMWLNYSNENVIESCSFRENQEAGLTFRNSNHNFITECFIEESKEGIIISEGSNNLSILNCRISDNPMGFKIFEIHERESIKIHNCTISGSRYWGVHVEQGEDMVNATNNYWGDPSGPYHDTENSEGNGDNVTDAVLFEPWLSTPPNQRPIAAILSITPNPAEVGENIHFTGNGTDDGSVVGYSWRSSLDSELYNGTKSNFDNSSLSKGTHTIYLKVLDDKGVWSKEISKKLTVTAPSSKIITINITSPVHGKTIKGNVTVTGTASSEGLNIQKVEYRLKGADDWLIANGTESWSVRLDSTKLDDGNYIYQFRAYDGEKYSPVQNLSVKVNNEQETSDKDLLFRQLGPLPFVGYIGLAFLMIMVTTAAVKKRKRRTRKTKSPGKDSVIQQAGVNPQPEQMQQLQNSAPQSQQNPEMPQQNQTQQQNQTPLQDQPNSQQQIPNNQYQQQSQENQQQFPQQPQVPQQAQYNQNQQFNQQMIQSQHQSQPQQQFHRQPQSNQQTQPPVPNADSSVTQGQTTPQGWQCPKCGNQVKQKHNFCTQCGFGKQ